VLVVVLLATLVREVLGCLVVVDVTFRACGA
jgi:hypothetical protein